MSENERFIDQELLARIEMCMAERGLSPTKFGEQAINDPDLVRELRKGRELRRKTRARIEAFIRAGNPPKRKRVIQ